jgi:hypothetical protein
MIDEKPIPFDEGLAFSVALYFYLVRKGANRTVTERKKGGRR